MYINGLPSNAKMVFKGKKYEVWQWEQIMYDGAIKIFEKVRGLNTVTVIALVDDKIILQRQEQPHRGTFLSLPGGGIEDGESPIDSIKRELLEETGYISDDIVLWKNIPSYYSSLIRDSYYFIARDCEKMQDLNLDNGEKIENQLISFEEFLMLSENENFRDKHISIEIMKLKLNPEEMRNFKEKLF